MLEFDVRPVLSHLQDALSGRRPWRSPRQTQLAWQAHQLSLARGFEALQCLAQVHIEHFPHQIDTALKVMRDLRGRALLADEVGLGKTVEAGLVVKEYIVRGLADRLLVLCPTPLVGQWREELATKFGLPCATTDDEAFWEGGQAGWSRFPRLVASLSLARLAAHREALATLPFDIVVLDEAHRVKNRTSAGWKLINDLQKKYLLLLTATPVQNDLDELYNIITLLRPGTLSSPAAFRKRFVDPRDPRRPRNTPLLRELLVDTMVRNTRSQVALRLPPREARTLRVAQSPTEAALYQQVSDLIRQMGRIERNRMLLSTLQAELGSSPQAAAGTLRNIRDKRGSSTQLDEAITLVGQCRTSTKAEALVRLLQGRTDKVLVFTRFRETQRMLMGLLAQAGLDAVGFGGGATAAERDEAMARFEGAARVLVSTEAGSEGRNLQFCRCVVNFDIPWNPMRIEQRVGRVHRIGQDRPVEIVNLVAADTLEDHLLRILDEKINMFELVMGEMEMILGVLDDERDFEDLVMDTVLATEGPDGLAQAVDGLGDRLLQARQVYEETSRFDNELFADEFNA